jgi:ATP-dependent DNA helicase RecQ
LFFDCLCFTSSPLALMPDPDLVQARILAEVKRIWGYDQLRSPQGEVIAGLLHQQDMMVVLPTGGGKSLCFQLPALMQSGVTLVVSPLVALMENQVAELRQRHLPAATLHSEVRSHLRQRILNDLSANRLRLLYLSPETLFSPPVWQRLIQPQVTLHGLVIDEAHCITQWGDSFRPAYQRLGTVRPALLNGRPGQSRFAIAAFTATADPSNQQAITTTLGLHSPQAIRLSPYRPNLFLGTQMALTPRDRRRCLLRYIHARRGQSGLVYLRRRRDADAIATWLTDQGIPTLAYHGGLGSDERRQVETDWLENRCPVVACTSAFGMGVNKPDVRWVVQFQSPAQLTEYVQEIGRAGRDGKPASALTLVGDPWGWLDPSDRNQQRFQSQKTQQAQQQAQRLAPQLPSSGTLAEVKAQHPDAELALAWLHRSGRLTWQDPFTYRLTPPRRQSHLPNSGTRLDCASYLRLKTCRWRNLLEQFGFPAEARRLNACGHCDNCRRQR